jgi:hypothetical protein
MENNMMELNLEDMEMVNGGWDLKRWIGNIGVSATVVGMTTGMIALAVSGPVGWAIIGGAAVGAAGAAVYTAVTDD